MMAKLPFAITATFASVFVAAVSLHFAIPTKPQQQNHAPAVKITSPKNGDSFSAGAQVGYKITVADKEDGDSKFDEINTKEVLLEVQYAADANQVSALTARESNDPPGLMAIRSFNCFNCHAFTGKLIGPSFFDISKKYAPTDANISQVAKRVKDGSAGIWGKVAMPTHPELSNAQTVEMVGWILKNAAKPNMQYYTGTQGVLRLTPPEPSALNGYWVLTASYIDHGLKNDSTVRLEGKDVIVLHSGGK
jgi:cytochrome c